MYIVDTSFAISGKKYIVRNADTGGIFDVYPTKSWAEIVANE